MEQQKLQSPRRFVIAISAVSGGGKSALANGLLPLLGDAIVLHFDDYAPVYCPTSTYPHDFHHWLEEGADPNAWQTPQLVQDIRTLLQGKPIVLPAKKAAPKQLRQARHLLKRDVPLLFPRNEKIVHPASFILLEEPFGRKREALKPLIDYVIVLDTPLEIALARRLLEVPEIAYFAKNPDEGYQTMLSYLHNYLHHSVREMYIAIMEQVLQHCDLVLDGKKPIDELAREASKRIRSLVTSIEDD
jgi:uridine kinase